MRIISLRIQQSVFLVLAERSVPASDQTKAWDCAVRNVLRLEFQRDGPPKRDTAWVLSQLMALSLACSFSFMTRVASGKRGTTRLFLRRSPPHPPGGTIDCGTLSSVTEVAHRGHLAIQQGPPFENSLRRMHHRRHFIRPRYLTMQLRGGPRGANTTRMYRS